MDYELNVKCTIQQSDKALAYNEQNITLNQLLKIDMMKMSSRQVQFNEHCKNVKATSKIACFKYEVTIFY